MYRCVYHAHAGVCVRAMRRDFLWLRPDSSPRLPIGARRARPHARAVRGRSIYGTKVKALPEWLGKCTLLEELCVRPRQAAASRVRDGAGAALLRVRCRAGRRAAPRGVGCGVAGRRPRPSPVRACLAPASDRRAIGEGRSRPARPHGGTQGRARHRARGAAGGGRVAQPEGTVSAPAGDAWPTASERVHIVHD
jgi:hypothetical protein